MVLVWGYSNAANWGVKRLRNDLLIISLASQELYGGLLLISIKLAPL
jgi:hypothetical protein